MAAGTAEITVNVNFDTKGVASLQPQGSPNSHIPKPSVGRIVHYWHTDDEVDDPWAAMIVKVVDGYDVELIIYWPHSYKGVLPFSDSPYPFSATPKPGHWSWPPRD